MMAFDTICTRCGLAFISALCFPSSSVAAAQDRLEVRRLADNVHAALQPSLNRFDDANSLIVVLADGVLVVDTQVSPAGAASVLAAIRAITDLPVRWVVNTHWHGDHVQGNQLYRSAFPDAAFIAHRTTGEDIEERTRTAHAEDLETIPAWLDRARAALESGVADGQSLTEEQKAGLRGRIERRQAYFDRIRSVTQFILPTQTVTDTMSIADGHVRLKHFDGHTRGDLTVYIPAARVLATGDLLDDLPFTGHGSPRGLLATLDSIEVMGAIVFVPGHGAIRNGNQHLEKVRALFRSIVTQVEGAVRQGLTLEATQSALDVEEHRKYFVTDDVAARYWAFFIPEAARKAWEEAQVSGGRERS